MVDEASVRRWSDAIRQIEVLEPWLTESHWDEHYWDDVARSVVEQAGADPLQTVARDALATALRTTYPDASFEADNGFYRDSLEHRLDLIVGVALDPPAS